MYRACAGFLFFILFLVNGSAQSRFKPGDLLYVWDPDGVPLLSSPVPDAPEIILIPYGEMVENIAGSVKGKKMQEELFRNDTLGHGVQLSWHWMKISWMGFTGFVPDYRFSRRRAFPKSDERLYEYLSRLLGVKAAGRLRDTVQMNEEERDSLSFYNGSSYRHTWDDGCNTYEIILKDFTLAEALWLLQTAAGTGYDCSFKLVNVTGSSYRFSDCEATMLPTLEMKRKKIIQLSFYDCD